VNLLFRFDETCERPNTHRTGNIWRGCLPPVERVSLIFALLCLASFSVLSQSSSDGGTKRVLLLSHYGRESPAEVLFQQGFDTILKSSFTERVEIYREALETYRFPGNEHERLMQQYLHEKYVDRKVDVVVAYTDTALDFLLRYRDQLFPNIPLVYVISRQPESANQPTLSTGVWTGPNIKDTLGLALQMQPDTRQVFVVGAAGYSPVAQLEVQEQLKDFESPTLHLNYLLGRPLDELLAAVRALPEHSIIIYQRQTQGTGGKIVLPRESVGTIAQAANAPVYVSYDVLIGQGTVGGKVISSEELGSRAAHITINILQGTRPGDIPTERASLVPMFDWRQLQRWKISEQRLPTGSIVLFKQTSFWELYRWRIIGVLALCLVQALLIVALLIQRSRRAKAEESRRLSEEKFSKAFRSSPDAFLITRQSDGVILEVNDRWVELLGYSPADAVGRTTADLDLYAVTDHREKFLSQLAEADFVSAFETKIRTRTGEIKLAVLAAEIVVINNEPCTLVMLRDVTEQRNSERALQEMTSQLISLRDEEQRRIAAELHDGLGQSLVIINNRALIGLRDARDTSRATEQFEEISSAASSAIDEVRAIVYNLRPHDLGKLGLVQAIKSMVTKISESSPIKLSTDLDELDQPLSEATETSIYRMVQEALNNIVKHAEATEARVALKRCGDELMVTVADNGKGITATRNGDRSGFGLVGIAERARMLGGSCAVDSKAGLGTTITLTLRLTNGDA
jgi:PAS domain S-box-containing protein